MAVPVLLRRRRRLLSGGPASRSITERKQVLGGAMCCCCCSPHRLPRAATIRRSRHRRRRPRVARRRLPRCCWCCWCCGCCLLLLLLLLCVSVRAFFACVLPCNGIVPVCSQVKQSLPGVDITRPLDPSWTAAITHCHRSARWVVNNLINNCDRTVLPFLNRGDDLTARSTRTRSAAASSCARQ